MKVAILDDWFDTLRTLPCYEHLKGLDVTVFTDHCVDIDTLADRLAPFDAITLFRERTVIGDDLLARLPNLKLISHRGAYPHVDVDACTRRGVTLSANQNKSTAPSYAAPEHTFALILAAMRQIPQQMTHMQAGNWQMGVGKTLYGRVLGLYGYGRISTRVAQYAEAFGMQVIWWASEAGRARLLADGRTVADNRAAFFETADVVSVHVRLVPETRGIITKTDLMSMREDALFVNTSRAAVIEAGALLGALNAGRPAQAALDVFDQEPIKVANDPIATHPRVICTPHIGFVTEDELNLQFDDIFAQVAAFAEGTPIHVINPAAA